MSKFYIFRTACRITGVLAGIIAMIGIILQSYICVVIGVAALAVDIVLIAFKNRCPFCRKALRIAPIRNSEFCPHCGCDIK